AYNGLTPSRELREGDELVLPRRPDNHDGAALADADPAYPVEAESAIDVEPLPGTPGTELAASAPAEAPDDSGWSPDLAAAAIERPTGLQEDGARGAPPRSSEPLPPEPPARRELESPELARYQTGSDSTAELTPTTPAAETTGSPATTSSGIRMIRPVEGR